MNKKSLSMIHCIFICVFSFLTLQMSRAQILTPSEWSRFVESSNNRQLCDTFRMQTFEDPLHDNWTYTGTGYYSVFDVSNDGIKGQGGTCSLKLALGSTLCFEHYPLDLYNNVKINIRVAGKNLMIGEDLKVKTYRPGSPEYAYALNPVETNGTSFNYRLTSTIINNPPGIDFIASSAASVNSNGYFSIDSVYAYGLIPAYSLFTGAGTWQEPLRWSHLPAARHRNALIQGDALINKDVECNDVFLSGGTIHLFADNTLVVNNLTLFNTEISLNKEVNMTENEVQSFVSNGSSLLTSSGIIRINERITICRTFSEKGKWYFVSFPFDVYSNGIDPSFKLQDEAPNGGGNYFYVLAYDGERRAQQNKPEGNWKVLPASVAFSSEPIFKKNKGYLLALDNEATRQSISFSSAIGDIPGDFGKKGTIPIEAGPATSDANAGNQGWYLCGNPLPSLLLLSDLTPNPSLDGNIYLYNGSEYTAYPLDGDYAIPPFSAFFVKASGDTFLQIANASSMKKNTCVVVSRPLPVSDSETINNRFPTSLTDKITSQSYIREGRLYLENLPSGGVLEIIDFTGHICERQMLAAGSSSVGLPTQKGIYLLNINSNGYRKCYKFVRTW